MQPVRCAIGAFAFLLLTSDEPVPTESTPVPSPHSSPAVQAPPPDPDAEGVAANREPSPRLPDPEADPWEDEAALDESRTQTNLFATAQVSAVYDNEDLLGVRINNVTPRSFWAEVGFRHGDVILESNGQLMDNPQASIQFMDDLSTSHVLIVRVRGEDDEERMLEFRTPR